MKLSAASHQQCWLEIESLWEFFLVLICYLDKKDILIVLELVLHPAGTSTH
jgi:hypothetical protein